MNTDQALRGWDLATWRLAAVDPSLGSSMVSVAQFAGELPLRTFLERLQRVVAAEPLLRSVVMDGERGPALRLDPGFDVRERVRLLPPETDPRIAAVAQLTRPFGYGDPLWRVRLLPRPTGTVLITVLNHAIADARGAFEMLTSVFDDETLLERRAARPGPARGMGPTRDNDFGRAVSGFLSSLLTNPGAVAEQVNSLTRDGVRLLERVGLPRALGNPVRGGTLQCAWFEAAATAPTAGAQHKLVAAAASAFAVLSRGRGAAPADVLVNVPVARPRQGANQLGVVRIAVPADGLEAQAEASRTELRRWLNSPLLGLADEAAELAATMPRELVLAAARAADLTVTALPETLPDLTLRGVAVRRWLPLAPPVGAAANVTLARSRSSVLVGTSWDPVALGAEWPQALRQQASRAFGLAFADSRL